MGVEALIAAVGLLAGIAGGWWQGRRGLASDTVTLLQASVAELREREADKDEQIINLLARVEVLEALVTQRAEVEQVKQEVQGVRGVVDRIATKVGA